MHFIFNQIAHNETYTLTNPCPWCQAWTQKYREKPHETHFSSALKKSLAKIINN